MYEVSRHTSPSGVSAAVVIKLEPDTHSCQPGDLNGFIGALTNPVSDAAWLVSKFEFRRTYSRQSDYYRQKKSALYT
jgi:hypothetical protein